MLKMSVFFEEPKWVGQRQKLVNLLKAKGITSAAVLDAIGVVPRHAFFNKDFELFAYRDAAFPIGNGQTISQPYTVAFQTELLCCMPGHKVLEIGTGSGYQAAVLATMGVEVHSIEVIKSLVLQARKVLKNIDIEILTYLGDVSMGLQVQAPFDRILVTAGAPAVPQALLNQLTVNGRMVIPVGDSVNQKMLCITKLSETQSKTEAYENFKFVPLVGKNGWNN